MQFVLCRKYLEFVSEIWVTTGINAGLALRSMQCQIFCHQGTFFDIIVKNGGLLTVADSSD